MGDGAAHGTSEGESRVQANAGELRRLSDLGDRDSSSSHCVGSEKKETEWSFEGLNATDSDLRSVEGG